MQALWGEPRTACSVFAIADGNEVVPFRGDVTDLWLLAKQCTVIPVTQRGQGSVERRRNGGAAKANSSVSMLRIRFLPLVFSQCFRVPYPNTAEKSQSVNGHQNRKRNFGRQSTISCAWKTGKEGQYACRKNPDRICLKGQMNIRCSKWYNKEHGPSTGILSKTNHPQSKPKEGKGEIRDLRGILVWIVLGTKPSGRTLDLYIYIYRQWRKSESTRNCGARWGSPQLIQTSE